MNTDAAVRTMLDVSMRIRTGDIALTSCVRCRGVLVASSLDSHKRCVAPSSSRRRVTLADIVAEYEGH